MSRIVAVLALLAAAIWLALSGGGPASAHVMPSTAVLLTVHEGSIDAEARIPLQDLELASGIDLGNSPATTLPAHRAQLTQYLRAHIHATTPGGAGWTTQVSRLALSDGQQTSSGPYYELIAHVALTPPTGASVRSFHLDYDAVISQVITHVILVSVRGDWATGQLAGTRAIGTIRVDPVTGKVPVLLVDLRDGSPWQGFTAMTSLGISHIAEGTDHQLFLLTLLLPAPLLATGRRWSRTARPRRAVRRITAITLAFTIGHSTTLAIGALGLPVPQQPVEALIAVSILIAAIHAIRPIFPGREPVIAAVFGLVHGLAFSATLTELDLSGGQLALSLLGFNLGIELMQLAIVGLVLPPLVLLARTPGYRSLRIAAAATAGVAAIGWALARVGVPNSIAALADTLGTASPWIVLALWVIAALVLLRRGRDPRPVLADRVVRPTT